MIQRNKSMRMHSVKITQNYRNFRQVQNGSCIVAQRDRRRTRDPEIMSRSTLLQRY